MRIVMFYHSITSDWNHGNAHFLRGIATELLARGHQVRVYEPAAGWSLGNLLREKGEIAVRQFRKAYPVLEGIAYDPRTLDLDEALAGVDLVIVHEWNEHDLVARIGEHRRRHSYRLLFHDTHHRCVSDAGAMAEYDLSGFDGVLAYGNVIREIYISRGWTSRAWTWHEAADVRIFNPLPREPEGDLVWIGNWGDDERTEELLEYLVEPVRRLRLKAKVYGVRYPEEALRHLTRAGIEYGGWLPNFEVPKVFSRYRVTLHIPRRPYTRILPGIPTIRPFEALACGIPLVCSPWEDSEGLFAEGSDFLVASSGEHMERLLGHLLEDQGMAMRFALQGRKTILERHTCGHRVDELMQICAELGIETGDLRRNAAGGQA